MANRDPDFHVETEPGKGYVLSGKIMLTVIVVLFIIVLFMVGFHLYARWYLIRLRHRRRQLDRLRMRRGGGRAHIVVYAANQRMGPIPDRGLDKKVLDSLPVYAFSPKTEPPRECAVCLSEFEEKDVVRHLPKCNHSFHIECIDMWFHSHSTCPLCRTPVEPVAVEEPDKDKSTAAGSEIVDQPESGSSSGGAPGASWLEGEGSGGRRKGLELVEIKIEIPPSRTGLSGELTQSSTGFQSPGNAFRSLRRMLSMNMKSPVGNGSGATPPANGTRCGVAGSNLGIGLDESN